MCENHQILLVFGHLLNIVTIQRYIQLLFFKLDPESLFKMLLN